MLQIAYSTNAFVRFPLADALEIARRLGFDGIELVADAPHLFVPAVLGWRGEQTRRRIPPEVPSLEALCSLIRTTSLPVSNVNSNTAGGTPTDNAGWTLSDPERARRELAVKYVCGAVDIAAAVGAPSVSVAGGPMGVHSAAHEGRRLFIESLSAILPHARANRIRIGIEAEPGLVVSTTDDVEWCLSELHDECLGANLDIGHCVVAGEDPCESARRLTGRIWHVHIEDIGGREHFHLVPGEGEIDFAAVLRALAGAGYDGFITLELYTYPHDPEGAGRAGLAHLRSFLEKVGA